MRYLLAFAILSLSGCAWIPAHIQQIAMFGTVAGAVAASESAVVNALELKDRVEK